MDFRVIQQFFSRIQCNLCHQHLDPKGIELIREERGMFLVSVYCNHCEKQIGVAMVGVEAPGNEMSGEDEDTMLLENLLEHGSDDVAQFVENGLVPTSDSAAGAIARQVMRTPKRLFDPELTHKERVRLSKYAPIALDDVLDAHHFFQGLDANWTALIPPEMRQPCKLPEA